MLKTKRLPKKSEFYDRALIALCFAAGFFYNSWPLGFILDNSTARHDLASDLELVGHPYYWLFVSCDLLAAACAILAAAIIILKFKAKFSARHIAAPGGGLFLFGLFTGIAALLPSQCTITPTLRCGAGTGKGLGLDALISSIAALGILIILLSLALKFSKERSGVPPAFTWFVLLAWSASGMIFVAMALTNRDARLSQNVLMILTGAAVVTVGLTMATLRLSANSEEEITS